MSVKSFSTLRGFVFWLQNNNPMRYLKIIYFLHSYNIELCLNDSVYPYVNTISLQRDCREPLVLPDLSKMTLLVFLPLLLFLTNWAFFVFKCICRKSTAGWLEANNNDDHHLPFNVSECHRWDKSPRWAKMRFERFSRWLKGINHGAQTPLCNPVLSAIQLPFVHRSTGPFLFAQLGGTTQWMSNVLRWGLWCGL